MKKIFLTSDLGCSKKVNEIRIATPLDNSNGFVENLKQKLNGYNKMVFVASSPTAYDITDIYANLTFEGLKLSGIEFDQYVVLDARNKGEVQSIIDSADLILLTGGFTFGQMQFFDEINLKNLLKDVDGVIVGQSAGSINLATNVYCSPESFEEIENQRIWPGLGLTDINIEPHFVASLDNLGDESKTMRRELLKDSFEYPVYAICDGVYVYDDGNEQTIYGESYYVSNGLISDPLCMNGETYSINKKAKSSK